MRFHDIARRAARSLAQAKSRTLLTSLAISVGAFAVVLSLALGAGGRAYTENIVKANTDVRELIVAQELPQTDFGQPPKPEIYHEEDETLPGANVGLKQLKAEDLDSLRHIEGVAEVEPAYQLRAEYITRAGQERYRVQSLMSSGSGPEPNLAAGEVNDTSPMNGIVLTEQYAKVLGFAVPQDAIGEQVDLAVKKQAQPLMPAKIYHLEVIAVSKQSSMALRANSSLLLTSAMAKEIYDYSLGGLPQHGNYLVASVIVNDAAQAESVKKDIEAMGYTAQTAEDLLGALFQFIDVLQIILVCFGVLAVITSVFGIINTQYISVLERTRQIGLMKALGMRRRDVGLLFRLEAAWIGLLGGAIGAALALVAGLLLNPWISETLQLGENRLLLFEPITVVSVVLGLMLVSVISGILPASKAAKLDPVEALRVE